MAILLGKHFLKVTQTSWSRDNDWSFSNDYEDVDHNCAFEFYYDRYIASGNQAKVSKLEGGEGGGLSLNWLVCHSVRG